MKTRVVLLKFQLYQIKRALVSIRDLFQKHKYNGICTVIQSYSPAQGPKISQVSPYESVLFPLSILIPHFLDIKSKTSIYTFTDLNSHDLKMSPYISPTVLRGYVHVCASVMDTSLFSPYSDPLSMLCFKSYPENRCQNWFTQKTGSSLSLSSQLHVLDVDMPEMILNWPQSDPHLVPLLASALCVRIVFVLLAATRECLSTHARVIVPCGNVKLLYFFYFKDSFLSIKAFLKISERKEGSTEDFCMLDKMSGWERC